MNTDCSRLSRWKITSGYFSTKQEDAYKDLRITITKLLLVPLVQVLTDGDLSSFSNDKKVSTITETWTKLNETSDKRKQEVKVIPQEKLN